jgi:hypothetical protein
MKRWILSAFTILMGTMCWTGCEQNESTTSREENLVPPETMQPPSSNQINAADRARLQNQNRRMPPPGDRPTQE